MDPHQRALDGVHDQLQQHLDLGRYVGSSDRQPKRSFASTVPGKKRTGNSVSSSLPSRLAFRSLGSHLQSGLDSAGPTHSA